MTSAFRGASNASSQGTRPGPYPRCWASKRNGELIALAVGQFEIFLTADRNLSHQQDLSAFDIAIVVLVARSNRLEDLRVLVPRLLDVLPTAARRAVTVVQA